MNPYTTKYAAEQLIWSIIDWEIIVNSHDEHRCWTEPTKGGVIEEHAFLIRELSRGFRADVGRKEFWHPHPENPWITQGIDAARIAYGPKIVAGLEMGTRTLDLRDKKLTISENGIDMYDLFKAYCDEHMAMHFIQDSLDEITSLTC